MTQAEKFEAHNAEFAVVQAEVLTKDKKRIYNGKDQANIGFTRYKFEDGSVRTVACGSLKKMPRWLI